MGGEEEGVSLFISEKKKGDWARLRLGWERPKCGPAPEEEKVFLREKKGGFSLIRGGRSLI